MSQSISMTQLKLIFLAGDGIGPEITSATKSVLSAVSSICKKSIEVTNADIGFKALETSGCTIPNTVRKT